MNFPKIRVVLADRGRTLRDTFTTQLDSASKIVIVAEADTEDAILGSVTEYNPDVLVIDTDLLSRNDTALIRSLRANSATTGVLLLVALENSTLVKEALNAGANGFLLKSENAEEIIEAIRDVYEANQVVRNLSHSTNPI